MYSLSWLVECWLTSECVCVPNFGPGLCLQLNRKLWYLGTGDQSALPWGGNRLFSHNVCYCNILESRFSLNVFNYFQGRYWVPRHHVLGLLTIASPNVYQLTIAVNMYLSTDKCCLSPANHSWYQYNWPGRQVLSIIFNCRTFNMTAESEFDQICFSLHELQTEDPIPYVAACTYLMSQSNSLIFRAMVANKLPFLIQILLKKLWTFGQRKKTNFLWPRWIPRWLGFHFNGRKFLKRRHQCYYSQYQTF